MHPGPRTNPILISKKEFHENRMITMLKMLKFRFSCAKKWKNVDNMCMKINSKQKGVLIKLAVVGTNCG